MQVIFYSTTYLRVNARLSLAGMALRKAVSIFVIAVSTKPSSVSNDLGGIRRKLQLYSSLIISDRINKPTDISKTVSES